MPELSNKYISTAMSDNMDWIKTSFIKQPDPPISIIYIGDDKHIWAVGVDKKFNWFQKKMLKWCFGFEVKENT